MIKVICVGGEPCLHVVNKCLSSVVNQTFKDWEMAVVLDPASYKIYSDDERIKLSVNENKMLGTYNTLEAVDKLDFDDDDILLFLDADDWLNGDDVLQYIWDTYQGNPDLLVTHGSFCTFPDDYYKTCYINTNKAYSREEFNDLRHTVWRASALRTVKYKIFKLIDDMDFRDDEGVYLSSGCDCAIMYPCLEMAGYDRYKFLHKSLYVYNVSGVRTPHTHKKESSAHKNLLDSREPYKRIP